MATQIVMDRTGDSRHEFDVANPLEVTDAEKRFNELVGVKKHAAFALGENGEKGTKLKTFDPTVERTLFVPPLQGG